MFPTLYSVTLVMSISLPVICYRYIHNQDWQNAQRVAEEHDPNSLSEVLLGQAKDVFSSKNYPHFESLLLRAQRPELIIKYYQVIWRGKLCLIVGLDHFGQLRREQAFFKGTADLIALLQCNDFQYSLSYIHSVQCTHIFESIQYD